MPTPRQLLTRRLTFLHRFAPVRYLPLSYLLRSLLMLGTRLDREIAYVAKNNEGSKDKTILFITDIFGFELVNVRLVADEYAAQGFHVLVPDFLEGKARSVQTVSET